MLEKKNPQIVTHLETDQIGQVKYYFMALDVFIRGFKAICCLMLCVDGSFLKHKCEGHMLGVIVMDANDQLCSMAFAMVDYENNNA